MPEGIRKRDDSPGKPWEASVWDVRAGRKVRRSFRTLGEARTWRADKLREARTGSLNSARTPRLQEAAAALVVGMRDGTIKARGGKPFRASVARKYGVLLDAYVLPTLGKRRLADVRHVDLLDLAAELEARGLAPSTVRNALDPVRVIFRRAVQRGELAANPAVGLELPGGDAKPRNRVAAPAEAAMLIEALPTARDRALWATAFYAAARAGEIRALRWRHVDVAGARLSIVESMDDRRATTAPKTRAGTRTVPITPHLRRHLLALRAEDLASPDALVFGVAPDSAFTYTTVYKHARRAWAAAELEPITLHEARHTCISTWIMAGVNLKTASAMAGHASISITLDRYGHLLPGAEDEAVARVSDYLGGS